MHRKISFVNMKIHFFELIACGSFVLASIVQIYIWLRDNDIVHVIAALCFLAMAFRILKPHFGKKRKKK